jgi:hypothetical protein
LDERPWYVDFFDDHDLRILGPVVEDDATLGGRAGQGIS